MVAGISVREEEYDEEYEEERSDEEGRGVDLEYLVQAISGVE